jgi:hypothetical protein
MCGSRRARASDSPLRNVLPSHPPLFFSVLLLRQQVEKSASGYIDARSSSPYASFASSLTSPVSSPAALSISVIRTRLAGPDSCCRYILFLSLYTARHIAIPVTVKLTSLSPYIRHPCLFVDRRTCCAYTKSISYHNPKNTKTNTAIMLASRAMKPKLSLSISTQAAQSSRPSLTLKAPLRSPLPPSPMSPTVRNTQMNQRGFSTAQNPTYAYANSSSSRSILKKGQSSSSSAPRRRQLQFKDEPTVNLVTPIEEPDYYGTYAKMTREERRWQRR